MPLLSQLKKIIVLFGKSYKKNVFSNSINQYIHSFKMNTSRTIFKGFEQDTFQVYLFTRGCNVNTSFNLHEVVFDSDLIANLSPESASIIGYYYGVNYLSMLKKNKGRIFTYSLSEDNNFRNFLISISRNKYINFVFKSAQEEPQIYSMHPFEIISRRSIINEFHPIHACYIGMQAGINYNKLKI